MILVNDMHIVLWEGNHNIGLLESIMNHFIHFIHNLIINYRQYPIAIAPLYS